MHFFGRRIGETNVVDIDVPPAALAWSTISISVAVADQIDDIPKIPLELFVIFARRRPNDLAALTAG